MDRIEGQIFLTDGVELPGAGIEVTLPGPPGGQDVLIFSDTLDHHGRFSGEVDGLANISLIQVDVRRPGYPTESLTFRLGQFTITPTIRRPTRDNLSAIDHVTLTLIFRVSWQMKLTLPQNEGRRPLRDQRAASIDVRSNLYPWSSALGIPLASVDVLPPPEVPTIAFLVGSPQNPGFAVSFQRNSSNTKVISERHPEERLDSIDAFRDQYDDGDGVTPPMRRPSIMSADYPPTTDGFPSDKSFAWQRLAGVNPVVLRLLSEFPKEDFPIAEANLNPYFRDFAALDRARREQRLYIADYEFLAGVEQHDQSRYLPAPFALFYYMGERPKDGPTRARRNFGADFFRGERIDRGDIMVLPGALDASLLNASPRTPLTSGLVPVAIQIDRKFDPISNPIFTPRDDLVKDKSWGIAKLMVQVADINYHETRTHLGEAHLLMEAFKVAMERTLDSSHPLYVLLHYHFEGLMAINYLAFRTLIAPGGGVDELLGNTLEGSLFLTERAGDRWNFQKRSFRADLEERGLLDGDSTIPSYPYRDDGLRVLSAIRNFVIDFVFIYYVNDAAVIEDSELSNWLKEMTEREVQGLPSIQTRSALVEFVTDIIFNCSARHASINYSQYDFVGFIPNMPAVAVRKPLRDDGTMITEILDILPAAKETRDMVELMANLSAEVPFGSLGMYSDGLGDPDANDAAKRFRDRLREVNSQIEGENQNRERRPYEYTYLMPRRIPNSTNI
jgi:arachidonate 15-lipoxygenase